MKGKSHSGLLALTLALGSLSCLPAVAQTGPLVGTVKTNEAWLLYRPGAQEKPLRLSVLNAQGQVVATSEATSLADNDYVAKFHVTGLNASTSYQYQVDDLSGGTPVALAGPAQGLKFKTPIPTGKKGVVTAAFTSCANDSSEPVWQRIGMLGVDQLFLCGDTPYVDVADLPTIRQKQRAFLETPFLASLVRSMPTAGTWDDHDFGLNGGNGVSTAGRKVNTRRGFVEYRAHDQYGDGNGAGIYHKVGNGVMEVFMLDPRWWSQTEASPVDPSQKTCFGPAQWQWLKDSLLASRATFKILVQGQVWQDKKNGETDDMFTYWYERDALLDFIKEHKIPGVVLFGGDIHVSRHLIHPQRIGYDLHDFIVSPAHTSVIPSLDVPHPDLEWSSQQPRQFLTITANSSATPPLMTARFYLADGTLQREVAIPYDQLTPKAGTGLGKDLRAWWPFDGNFTNHSVLGARVNATAVNNASLVTDGGLRGGAASFSRADQQYLLVPRSPLDDNSPAHTVSAWCKPASLPAPGSSDRHFLMESTLGGTTSDSAGYSISIGLGQGDTPENVSLQLFTRTLVPAVSTSTSPTEVPSSAFNCYLPRTLFTNRWAHVAMTFDTTHLRLYVDGTEVASHALPVPGPSAEFGGLVIGGHRAGTGRNFDGLLDEIAIWQRVLAPSEIVELYHTGTPEALPTAVAAADTDGDSLEDWYESLNGLDPNNADDALSDADGDQVPAYVEREAGTSPLLDDSLRYDFVRDLVSTGNAPYPTMVFRNPSTNTIRMKVSTESSTGLETWDAQPPSATVTAAALPDALGIDISSFFETKGFFRVSINE